MNAYFSAPEAIIRRVVGRLRQEQIVGPLATFVDNGRFQLRRDVFLNDPDFKHFAESARQEEPDLQDSEIWKMALDGLKMWGWVAPDAVLHVAEPDGKLSWVHYRDSFFLKELCSRFEKELAIAAADFLRQIGFVTPSDSAFWDGFERFREQVKSRFDVPGTSITPAMERLLYLLGAVKRPRRLLAMGIYCGNTLIWNLPTDAAGRFLTDRITGVEIDEESVAMARRNFAHFQNAGPVNIVCGDGVAFAEAITEEVDYVYLDADNQELGKGLYLEILQRLYPKIARGGWVVAHDVNFPYFRKQLEGYQRYVRDPKLFSETITFDVDAYGIELSIK